jgi:DNA-binding GntR family transcriptional regulator
VIVRSHSVRAETGILPRVSDRRNQGARDTRGRKSQVESEPVRKSTAKPAGGAAKADSSTQTDHAYRALKQMILDNQLSPGTHLLELEAANLLGVSRTPVREAMVRLDQEGLIALRARHGMRVLPISPEDMEEIYQILTALEAAAAEIVASKPPVERGLDLLNRAIRDMTKALDAGALEKWAEADERFHKLLIELAGNKRLAASVNLHWEQAHRARMVTLRLRPKPTSSMLDHKALVAAIEEGKPSAARRIHREHRRRSGKMLIALLRKYGLSSI